jgi:hypothetical protein
MRDESGCRTIGCDRYTPPIPPAPESLPPPEEPEDETIKERLTIAYLGGITTASIPGVSDDGNGHSQVTNKRGAASLGLIELVNLINLIAKINAPNSPANVNFYLSYTTLGNGDINHIVITTQNGGDTNVVLSRIAIVENPLPSLNSSVANRAYQFSPQRGSVIQPGQAQSFAICGNCIGENTIDNGYMPFSRDVKINTSIVVTVLFDWGAEGVKLTNVPLSYTIPRR